MNVQEVAEALARIAPPHLAEGWDNVGLLVGDVGAPVKKLLLCIDLTEKALAEAARIKAQMVMAYHPAILQSISRVTSDSSPVAYAAARKGLAVYTMHTALDAVPGGTNDVLADVLGLQQRRALQPTMRAGKCKVVSFVPAEDLSTVADAAFQAGAGRIGMYERCAFFCHGIGTFQGMETARPTIGQVGRQEATEELRLEVLVPIERVAAVCQAIRTTHSYEEPIVEVYPLEDYPADHGLGRVGRLERPVGAQTLIGRVKKKMGLQRVSVAWGGGDSRKRSKRVEVAACCAGSSGALYRSAAAAGATFYLTGEMRHHEALAAAQLGLTVVCVGHSNSERMALRRLAERLGQMLPHLAVAVSNADRDPFDIV
jgi:dinuclear metal center YbgI/SA1388 family protein